MVAAIPRLDSSLYDLPRLPSVPVHHFKKKRRNLKNTRDQARDQLNTSRTLFLMAEYDFEDDDDDQDEEDTMFTNQNNEIEWIKRCFINSAGEIVDVDDLSASDDSNYEDDYNLDDDVAYNALSDPYPCILDIEALTDIINNISISRDNHILIMAPGNLLNVKTGELEPSSWISAITRECDKIGATYDIITTGNSSKIMKMFTENCYSSFFAIGIGLEILGSPFFNKNIKRFIVNWVSKGGRLLIQGSNKVQVIFQEWFHLSGFLVNKDSARLNSRLNPNCQSIPNDVKRILEPIEHRGRCLSHAVVREEDAVLCDASELIAVAAKGGKKSCTVKASVTFSRFERGFVSFFGAVEPSPASVNTVVRLASFDTASFNYDRRASFIQALAHSKLLHDNLLVNPEKLCTESNGNTPTTVVNKVLSTKGLVQTILSFV